MSFKSKRIIKNKRGLMASNEYKYCRLNKNGAIDKPCNEQCQSCESMTPDDLLKQNFTPTISGIIINEKNKANKSANDD